VNKTVSSATYWQTTFVFTFLANLVILIWSISRWIELKVVIWRSVWLGALLLYLGVLAGCLFLFFWIRKGNANRFLAATELEVFSAKPVLRIAAGAIFAGLLWAIPYLKFTYRVGEVVKKSTQDPVLTTILFYWAVWWLVLLAASALKVAFKTSWAAGFAAALVTLGVAYELFVRAHLVTTYPLSMGWSEASRFYYGSLYFAQSVYGMRVPLSTLHPSRYFLQSLPFLFPNLGLTFSRFWQVFLWVTLTGITAFALSWRAFSPLSTQRNTKETFKSFPLVFLRDLRGQSGLFWLFAGWIFLYLLRVGVYYHLELMVFIPLLWVSAKHPWRSLAAVILASAWAGVSRVNWFPFPAMLAVVIYLLEVPVGQAITNAERPTTVRGSWSIVTYLRQPALWTITGLLTALAAQAAYIPLSGNAGNAKAFASSFSSDLLWYRLWPNDSYPLGIVPAILMVSGPLLALVLLATLRHWKALHPLRWVGVWGLLLVLFAGGLVVSVKIGGGGDLHNVDAYAVLVSVVAAWFLGDKVIGENGQRLGAWSWPVAAVALLIPVIFLVPALSPFQKFNQNTNQEAFRQLKSLAEGANGPVLFINERHLLTFHQIDKPLIPEYEAVMLMEMAMSNNQPYLQRFYTDLRSHRFAGIVVSKQNLGIKEEGAFAEENNAWNTRVSPYIVCYYEPVTIATAPELLTYLEADESRIEFYVPRVTPAPAGVCP
jgi:hypothetical protein